jgi:glucose-1-phosphate thymidylyltransferase
VKVIVLCGGLGSRLRPHTLSRPKPLLTVAGRPVLSHILDKLTQLKTVPRFATGLEFIFVIGYLGEQIVEFVAANYPALTVQFVEQPQPLGSGEAAFRARQTVLTTGDTDLLLLYSDTLFDLDFDSLAQLPADLDGVVFWRKTEEVSIYGAVVVDEATGLVKQLVEKPQTFVSNLAVTSPYYFTSAQKLYAALEELIATNRQTRGEYYFTDAVQLMIDKGAKLQAHQIPFWSDTGNFESWLGSNRTMLDRPRATGTRQLDTALIIEPCYIGAGVSLERSIIGPHVAVGEGAIIKDSIINDCIIEDGAEITDSVLHHSIIGRKASLRGQPGSNLSFGDYSKS